MAFAIWQEKLSDSRLVRRMAKTPEQLKQRALKTAQYASIRGNVACLSRGQSLKLLGPKVPRQQVRSHSSSLTSPTAFVGVPGTGKTMQLVRASYVYHLRGARILSNGLGLKHEEGEFSSFDDLCRIMFRQSQVPYEDRRPHVILIDEAHFWANSRQWQEFHDGFFWMLQQVRKFRMLLLWSAIDWAQCDVNLRRITRWIWQCERGAFGGFKSYLMVPPEERRPGESGVIDKIRWRPRESDVNMYDSGHIIVTPASERLVKAGYGASAREGWSESDVRAATELAWEYIEAGDRERRKPLVKELIEEHCSDEETKKIALKLLEGQRTRRPRQR